MAQYSARDDGLLGVVNSQQLVNDHGKINRDRDSLDGFAKQFHPEKKEGTLGVKFSERQPYWGVFVIQKCEI